MKRAIITGGNAGLGLQQALELSRRRFAVTISVRTADKGIAAVAEIERSVPGSTVDFITLDNNDLSTAYTFAKQFGERHPGPLDVLINNAGIMATPFALTKDGFESQFQVNHLAGFLLTSLLLPQLRAAGSGPAGEARVIFLASRAHLRWQRSLDLGEVRAPKATAESYDAWLAYGRSKTCNIRGYSL
jgi:NAD(P)-dependent dehydrogenase (short-subunit alcohol dehydrogenase family)